MTKRLWTLSLLAAFLVVVGSGAAFAIPSLGGPTGIVTVPTANVAPANGLQTALTYQSLETGSLGMYGPAEDITSWTLQVLGGVSDQAELWAAYSTVSSSNDFHTWEIGGKMQIAPGSDDTTKLAVGASYGSWQDVVGPLAAALGMYGSGTGRDVDILKAYIVATRDFTPMAGESWEWSSTPSTRMLGSAGVMYISVDPSGGSSESLARPFVGFEFIGPEGTVLGLEYRWKDSDLDAKAVFSAVLRHPFTPALSAEIGTTNAGPGGFGLDDQDIFVRLGYDIAYNQPGW